MDQSLNHIQQVYFIGIGGIGMSALALWFYFQNKQIAGYDKNFTEITDELSNKGIIIHSEDEISYIPEIFLKNKKNTLIVYTPAIPKEHKQLSFFVKNKYWILKRAQVLGLITKNKITIAVAGTHGKTTTCAIISHIIYKSNLNFTTLLGGISSNFNTNFITNRKSKSPEIIIIEADEYDRSFLNLTPDIAIITSIESDHLDIYRK